jgi:hypothetical protein
MGGGHDDRIGGYVSHGSCASHKRSLREIYRCFVSHTYVVTPPRTRLSRICSNSRLENRVKPGYEGAHT